MACGCSRDPNAPATTGDPPPQQPPPRVAPRKAPERPRTTRPIVVRSSGFRARRR